jgi:protein-L-isoaspartate(D-aspartate) O-methyltransferase
MTLGIALFSFSERADGKSPAAQGDPWRKARFEMVQYQLRGRGIRDRNVLKAMERVPRHLFVPHGIREHAYADSPLPIGHGQTISQPFVVAAMTEALELSGGERVLEIGTGSGYQAAVLAEIAGEVYTIEIVPELAADAGKTLQQAGYENVFVRAGDGWKGWPERAPFDAVMVTAAPEEVPPPLLEQLKTGGRLVIPVGPRNAQELLVYEKTSSGLRTKKLFPVRFVPFTRETEPAGSR